MKAKKKGKKSRALAKRKKMVVAKRRKARLPAQDKLAIAAQKTLGVRVTSSRHYFRPVMTNEQIFWVRRTDRKTGNTSERPFVPFNPILDNVHRRGVKRMAAVSLPSVPCEGRCYMASKGDMTFRAKAMIELWNGQIFEDEGDACQHNTWAKGSEQRQAQTRALARAGRIATNIAAPCIVELASFEGKVRVGDRILSDEDMGKVVQGEVLDSEKKGAPVVGSPTERAMVPAGGKPTGPGHDAGHASTGSAEANDAGHKSAPSPATEAVVGAAVDALNQGSEDERQAKVKGNARLHAEASRLKLDVPALHAYIHRMENVKSITELTGKSLHDWADNLTKLKVNSRNHQGFIEMLEKYKS